MNIGLLGCGVVGGGILDFCAERADLTVAKVLVRRPRPELGALAVTDIADITGDPTIGIVIEVMGGLHPAAAGGRKRRVPALYCRRGRRHSLACKFGTL